MPVPALLACASPSDEDGELSALAELVQACSAAGVTFVYSLAPGLDIPHWNPEQRALLAAKITQLIELGVTSFALLFDDIPDALCEQDAVFFASQVREWRGQGGFLPDRAAGDLT